MDFPYGFSIQLHTRRGPVIYNPEFYVDLVYKFKKIIGNPNFSDLFKRIIYRFKRTGYKLNIMWKIARPVLTQSWLKAMLHSLVARR